MSGVRSFPAFLLAPLVGRHEGGKPALGSKVSFVPVPTVVVGRLFEMAGFCGARVVGAVVT